jgi:glutamate-1-semialdehyde aminotransferase
MAQKKTVTATIVMDELLYDIMNETYLRGRTIQNDTNYKEVASMFASLDEENQDKILRSIKKAFSEVKTELAEYLSESGLTTDNKLISADSDLVLTLTMPSNFNEAATAGVSEAVHDYIRNTSVGDWYLVTNKDDAVDYVSLAAKSLENIRKSVSKRSRPMRRAN